MDDFTWLQMAQKSSPILFGKNVGVASSDNFFLSGDSEETLDSAVATSQKLFYQSVNSPAQTEAGQLWWFWRNIFINAP